MSRVSAYVAEIYFCGIRISLTKSEIKDVKYGRLALTSETQLKADWHESQFAKNFKEQLAEAKYSSDIYWFRVENQAQYDENARFCGLPDWKLPDESKCYIISLDREIEEFGVSRLYRYETNSTDYEYSANIDNIVYNLEEPIYRGAAKYSPKSEYGRVYVYSAEKINLVDPRSLGLQKIY